jgi:hypothetical protein
MKVVKCHDYNEPFRQKGPFPDITLKSRFYLAPKEQYSVQYLFERDRISQVIKQGKDNRLNIVFPLFVYMLLNEKVNIFG